MIHNINRFTPLFWRRGVPPSRNRIVVPPMASQTAGLDGSVTAQTLDHYQRLASAGAGMTFVEYTYVHPSGRSEEHQLGASLEGHVAGLAKIAVALKAQGTLPGLQLTHSGGKTEVALSGGLLMAPSDVPVPVKDREMGVPTPMTAGEIELWHDSFVAAAGRAVAAGFPLVELHAAHGYGLNQWLSPLTNKRSDAYGGTQTRRARLLVEICTTIRARFPQLLLAVRLAGQDHLTGGLTQHDARLVAQLLIEAGVDLIDVSSGLGGWRRPQDRVGEGYLVPEAAAMQAAVSVPVIGVGGIETGTFVDKALRDGQFSLAAVGRAILADPLAWRMRHLPDHRLGRQVAASLPGAHCG